MPNPIGRNDKKMDAQAIASVSGARLASVLRQKYPNARAKRIAADFNVKPETAQGWLNGRFPQSAHFLAMCQRWGDRFTEFVAVKQGEWDELEASLVALDARFHERERERDA